MEDVIQEAFSKGFEMHKAGKHDLAKQLYTSILQLQPQHPDANHNLGVIEIDTGNITKAIPFLQTALQANPEQEQYWVSYIETLIKLDALDDARSMLRQAKEKGASGDVFDQLEQTLNDLAAHATGNRSDNSPDEILSGTSTNVNPPQEQWQALIELYNQGQLQQTLVKATQILQDYPNAAMVYNIQGATYAGLGKLHDAIDSYKKSY
jgi:tetratricopeptide (TPR) repeat protein